MSKKTPIELIRENPELMKLFEMIIPKGDYCYTSLEVKIRDDGLPVRKVKTCPFWDKNDEKHYQEAGYCHLLGRGDWEMNDVKEYVNDKTGEKQTANEIGLPLSLLWDQCKECGLNYDDREFEDEYED